MSMQSQFEREEAAITEMLNNGELTVAQYNEAMRDLEREYRGAMEDACQDAYDRERDNW